MTIQDTAIEKLRHLPDPLDPLDPLAQLVNHFIDALFLINNLNQWYKLPTPAPIRPRSPQPLPSPSATVGLVLRRSSFEPLPAGLAKL